MADYTTATVNINDLLLDAKNPRFIVPPRATQQDIINYLVEYEEVLRLVNDINQSKGLLAGERIIAIKDNDKYIVLEGNRRVCACKMILDPTIIPPNKGSFSNSFFASDDTKSKLCTLSIDIMPYRIDAHASMAAKHIDGIRKWSPLSKMKYFVRAFDDAMSIDEISMVTSTKTSKVKSGIKDFRLFDYALKLSQFSDPLHVQIDPHEVKINRYLQILKSKGDHEEYLPRKVSLSYLLKLSYNDSTLKPYWGIPESIVQQCIYILAKSTLLPEATIGTRNTFYDIPELVEFLVDNEIIRSISGQISIREISGTMSGPVSNSDSWVSTHNVGNTVVDTLNDTSPYHCEKNNTQHFSTSQNPTNTNVANFSTDDHKTNDPSPFEDEDFIKTHKPRKPKTINTAAFTLSRNYSEDELNCMGIKGISILYDIHSLNVMEHPYAAVALCRILLEYISKTWSNELNVKYTENTPLGTLVSNLRQMLISSNQIGPREKGCMKELYEKHIERINGIVHVPNIHFSYMPVKDAWESTRMLVEMFIISHQPPKMNVTK